MIDYELHLNEMRLGAVATGERTPGPSLRPAVAIGPAPDVFADGLLTMLVHLVWEAILHLVALGESGN